jgi:hypothetical protein
MLNRRFVTPRDVGWLNSEYGRNSLSFRRTWRPASLDDRLYTALIELRLLDKLF